MDKNGKFKAELRHDVVGLLSLYEASHLGFEGESVLDKAKAFSKTHLQNAVQYSGLRHTKLREHVTHVLELPYHQRMHTLEARYYIEKYDKNGHHNQLLLELAQLDFNMVQSLYQQELREMTRWSSYILKNIT